MGIVFTTHITSISRHFRVEKIVTYICKRLFPRLELTTSESNLSSKNEFFWMALKYKTAQTGGGVLYNYSPTKQPKQGEVCFKTIFLSCQTP